MGALRPGETMTSPANTEDRSAFANEGDAPRMESWLKVCLTAFVPLVLAFVLPKAVQPYLFTVGGLLVLCGIVMLIRQERGNKVDVRA
jgi:hypothetical protein